MAKEGGNHRKTLDAVRATGLSGCCDCDDSEDDGPAVAVGEQISPSLDSPEEVREQRERVKGRRGEMMRCCSRTRCLPSAFHFQARVNAVW